jgi:hypothetical protein
VRGIGETYDEALGVKLACINTGIESTSVFGLVVTTWTVEALLDDAGLDRWCAHNVGSSQSGEEGGDDSDSLHFEVFVMK